MAAAAPPGLAAAGMPVDEESPAARLGRLEEEVRQARRAHGMGSIPYLEAAAALAWEVAEQACDRLEAEQKQANEEGDDDKKAAAAEKVELAQAEAELAEAKAKLAGAEAELAQAKADGMPTEALNNKVASFNNTVERLKNEQADDVRKKLQAENALLAAQIAGAKREAGSEPGDVPPGKRQRVGVIRAGPELCAFWEALRSGRARYGSVVVGDGDEREEFKTIDLPDGVHFFGVLDIYSSQRLLVRPLYEETFARWTGAGGKFRKDGLVGTPGSGKSFFLLYALCRLGLERHPGPIVFQDTSGDRLHFHGDAVLEGTVHSFAATIKDPDTIYFVDGAANSLPALVNARTFLAASPNKRVYNGFVKATQHFPLIQTLWSRAEMRALHMADSSLSDELTVDQLEHAFEMTGGVPRSVMYWASNKSDTPEEQIRGALGTCNLEVCRRAADTAVASEDTVPHTIFHVHPKPDNPRGYKLQFASPYAERQFVSAFLKQRRQELVQFLASSQSLPAFPSLRGVLYEGYAIRRLQEGGEFMCCELKDGKRGKPKKFKVPSARELLFRQVKEIEAKDALDAKVHHRPSHGVLETVDSFVSLAWLFQVTIASSHDVKITGLNTALHHLRKCGDTAEPRLFFVVPQAAFDAGYRARQPLKTKAGAAAAPGGTPASSVKQFVICVPFE